MARGLLVVAVTMSGATCRIADLINVKDAALLKVVPALPESLKATSAFGSTAPQVGPIDVSNDGGGELHWQAIVKHGSPWVRLDPDSGTAGQTPTLQAVFDPSGLDSGVYMDTVVVSDRSGTGSLVTPLWYQIHSCETEGISLDGSVDRSLTTADCGALHKPRGWFAKLFTFSGVANDSISIELDAAFNAYVALDTSLVGSRPPLKAGADCLGTLGDPCLYYNRLPLNTTYYVEVTSTDSAATGAFTLRVVHPRKPDLPDSLEQRLATDSTTPVVPGGVISQQSVVLTAVLSDPDLGDSLQLQAEVIPTGSNFSVPTALGAKVPNGSRAYVLQSGLSDNTSYHWRLRAVDQTGRPGDWKVFPSDPAFNVQSGHDPTFAGANQYQSNGTTVIPVGDTANGTTVVFKAQLNDVDVGNQLFLQVEAEPVGTQFDSVASAASAPVAPGATATVTIPALTIGANYHWQARVVDNTTRHSGWASFGGNAESATDFHVSQPPAQLNWVVQPGATATAGIPISGFPQVAVQDQNGVTITTFSGPVTMAISTIPSGGQVTLLGTTTVNASSGIATFQNLIIDTAKVGYRLTATAPTASGTISSAESNLFNVTAAPATQLAFIQQPSNTTAGAVITPPVTVSAKDQFGNVNTTFTGQVTVAIANNGGNPTPGTLIGTLTKAAIAGVATFSDLSINKTGVGYTLRATSGTLTVATSAAFNITPGPATHLAFTVQPLGAAATQIFNPPVQVSGLDANDNLATSFVGSVTVAIGANPGGGTLSGTKTKTAGGGSVSFSDLSIDKAGVDYTLTATTPVTGVAMATSQSFTITPSSTVDPVKSSVLASPTTITACSSGCTVGSATATTITVTARDGGGNPVPNVTATITVTGSNNFPALTPVTTNASGVATWILNSTKAELKTVSAIANSTPINQQATYTVVNATASTLAFTPQPGNATAGTAINAPTGLVVNAQDQFGNTATNFGASLTMAIAAGPVGGTFAPTSVNTATAASGIATFPSLRIYKAGTGYRLLASGGGLTSPQSNAFNITAGPPIQLAFIVEPADTTAVNATITPAIQVAGQDSVGNTVPTYTGNVTVALFNPPGGAVLNGTKTKAAVSGVASFNDLSVNQVGTNYQLIATASGLFNDFSALFTIKPGPVSAAASTISASPATITASNGSSVSTITVTAKDAGGNPIQGVTVVLAATGTNNNLTQPAGTTNASGVATGTLSSTKAEAKTVSATVNGVPITQTAPVTVNPANAATLSFAGGQPTNTAAGAIINAGSGGVKVTAFDAFSNVANGFNSSVNVVITNGTGAPGAQLSGTRPVNAVAGVATFNDLSINKTGNGYTLTASATGTSNAVSSAFSITAGTPTQLVITQQPSSTAQSGVQFAQQPVVQIEDANGNFVSQSGTQVTAAIVANPGGSLIGTTAISTIANGTAAFTNLGITGTAGGYTLSFSGGGLKPDTSNTITLSAGGVSASQSAASAAPTTITACSASCTTGGGTASLITVTAKDGAGNPIQGATVVLSASGAGGTFTSPTTTNASGVSTSTFTSTVAEAKTITVTISGVQINQQPAVTVNPAGVSGGHSTLGAAPTTITACVSGCTTGGGTASLITATAKDQFDNLIQGATVVLAANPTTGNNLVQPVGTTNASGIATGTLSSTTAEAKTVSATINSVPVTQTATVTVTASSTPSTTLSTAGAAPTTIAACTTSCTTGGGTASLITVTAKDAGGNPIQGATVVLSSTGSNNNFTSPTTTNASGVSTSTFSSTTAEAKTISATINGVAITQTASVTVTAAGVSAGQSTVGAAPASMTACSTSCTTGGGTASLITVTAKDPFGNTVQGATVVLSSTGSNNNFTAPGNTNSSGVATSTFSSSTAESKTVSATINGVAITQKPSVTVNPAAVSATQSTVSAAQSSMTACQTSCTTGAGTASLITVTAKDAFGNVISGATVTLGSSGSNNSFTTPGNTNSSGVSTATFSSTKAESKTVSATVNGVNITQTASVAVTAAAATQLTFTAPPTNTKVSTNISPAVVVTALDQFNNVATGFTGEVTMAIGTDPSGGAATLTYTAPVNAVLGVAQFSDLQIDVADNGYTLVASATSLSNATSISFNITP